MQHLSRDHTFTAFYAELGPVCGVDAGEWLVVETWDCFGGRTLAGTPREDLPRDIANPATGPIYLRRAQPGTVEVGFQRRIERFLELTLFIARYDIVRPSPLLCPGSHLSLLRLKIL